MKNKGTIMLVLGLLALTLATVEHVSAKGSAVAEPITYDFIDHGSALTHETLAKVKANFVEEGKRGMHFVGTYTYAMPGVPMAPATPTTPAIPQIGAVSVFASR